MNDVKDLIEQYQPEPTAPETETPVAVLPAEELPITDAPAADATAEELPIADVPADDAPAEELPIAEAPAADDPAEDVPIADVPAADAPTEELPITDAPAEELPAEDVPASELDSAGRRIVKPYHERAYLLYGGAASLDLAGTKRFLDDIGLQGGELRQAREGKGFAEVMQQAEGDADTKNRCSYCGAEISGVDFYRLPDGRLRCTTCSRTLVKTQDELQTIYQRVLKNLEAFFGATLKVPVEIAMLEERKLKRKLKRPLSEVDDKSLLILGVAVNSNKRYSIFLENGSPRISLIATFAHELTHIWQYTHWDKLPKLPAKKQLLIYEGMAKWTEIQYLYLIGETAVAKREEAFTRTRKDEYGFGFLLYENLYPLSREAMMSSESPFITDRYPLE